jgi:integrase
VDLDAARLRVVTIRSYPKSRAGIRSVPMRGFLVDALQARRDQLRAEPRPSDLVFAGPLGTAPRRANFRKRVWLPSLFRAGLLDQVVEVGPYRFRGIWRDREGIEWSAEFTTEREAVEHVALRAVGGLRFHDLRHSYASWLVTDGLPVNVVQRVIGHEQASFTLNRYTHARTTTRTGYGGRSGPRLTSR